MVLDSWDTLMMQIVLILCKRFDDEKNREERRKRERGKEYCCRQKLVCANLETSEAARV